MENNPFYRALFENAVDAILVADDDGRYVDANPAACALLGYSREQLIGRRIADLRRPEDEAATRALWDGFRGESRQIGEIILRAADDSPRRLEYSAVADVAPGRHVAFLRDVGEKRELERLRTEKMQREVADALEANRAKSMFLANISHELRTPLNSLLGFSDLLRDADLSEDEAARFHEIVARSGRQLLRLIDDLLDLARAESGQMALRPAVTALSGLLAEAIAVPAAEAHARGLKLNVETRPSVPETIVTDPSRLKQILQNVIGNAVKFTSEGSVDVEVSAAGGTIRFDVKDTGIGIAPGHRDQLFRPFTMVDPSSTRRHGGTGLGLVLSRRIAQALGGSVELVESRPGLGSVFRISVSGSLRDAVFPEAPSPAGSASLKGRRVLLVEDTVDNQTLIRRHLESRGATVEVADDGKDALELAFQAPFDMILMDLQMPVLDGRSATKLLRMKGYAGPIVAVTAHAAAQDRDAALAAGCSDFVTKPIEFGQLVATMLKHL